MDNKKTLETLKAAKMAVDQANIALSAAIQELDDDALDQVSGGGEFDEIPAVDKTPYKDSDRPRY